MNALYNKILGRHLGNLRRERGLTQEQFVAKVQVTGCDMTRSALAKIEVGQRCLYPDELKAVKSVLDIAYEELLI